MCREISRASMFTSSRECPSRRRGSLKKNCRAAGKTSFFFFFFFFFFFSLSLPGIFVRSPLPRLVLVEAEVARTGALLDASETSKNLAVSSAFIATLFRRPRAARASTRVRAYTDSPRPASSFPVCVPFVFVVVQFNCVFLRVLKLQPRRRLGAYPSRRGVVSERRVIPASEAAAGSRPTPAAAAAATSRSDPRSPSTAAAYSSPPAPTPTRSDSRRRRRR